jgi:hypothetical protein
MSPSRRFWTAALLLVAALLAWEGCDSVTPEEGALLVVEGFVDAGKPLPALRLRQTRSLDQPYPFDAGTAVADAEVVLTFDGVRTPYRPDAAQPGRYLPASQPDALLSANVAPGAFLTLDARWRTQQATAESRVPPPIRLDSVRVTVPEEPVDGIILDSLFIDPVQLDSLQLDSLRTGAVQGLVYLVEVTLSWTVAFEEVGPDSAYWIRAQLRPFLPTRPVFDDFFFKPEQILSERSVTREDAGRRSWTGVYAVPVEQRDEPLPPHPLRVAIIRSGQDYARYASSRDDPERREPVSNVHGGVGIFAGLSIDSLRVQVE